jgi:hypothetical protein
MRLFAMECERRGRVAALCRARAEYFAWIVAHGHEKEAAVYLKDTLTSVVANETAEWEGLAVKSLAAVVQLSESTFAAVVDPSLELLCDLIEAVNEPGRSGVVAVIHRKLHIT